MTHFRVRWERRGEHIYARLFSAKFVMNTYALNGTLVFTELEWQSFLRCFNNNGVDQVTVVPEDGGL